MFDWHSEFLVIQARQREIAGAARFGRWLAEARASARSGGRRAQGSHRWQARHGSTRRSLRLRHRLGAALVLLGRRMQDEASQLPAAFG